MVTFVKGYLLEDNAQMLVNTVNTVGVMGKGVALEFKRAFPHNFRAYQHACKYCEFIIGALLVVEDNNLLYGKKLIVNFPTKKHWRDPAEDSYIEKGLFALRELLIHEPEPSVAMPALGCGNGGLEWHIVKQMILAHLGHLAADIRVYEP